MTNGVGSALGLTSDGSGPGESGGALDKLALAQALDAAHLTILSEIGVKRQIVATAARQLFRNHLYGEVIALVDASGLTFPGLLELRSLAVSNLQAARTGAAPDAPEKRLEFLENRLADGTINTRQFLSLKFQSKLRLTAEDYRRLWDTIPESLDEALAGFSPEQSKDMYTEHMFDTLLSLRADPQEDRDTFIRRLLWGQTATEFLTFLRRFVMMLHVSGIEPDDYSDDERAILHLNRQLNDLARPPATDEIAADIDAGKSIVLLGAHTGMHTLAEPRHLNTTLRIADVNQMTTSDLTSQDRIYVGTASKNFNMEFVAFLKQVRKRQSLIRILPDGSNGSEMKPVTVLGKQIKLGQGGALLGWKASAACYFYGGQWVGRRVQLYLLAGPDAADFDRREDFDAAFYDFYVDCLARIIQGPPEDMAARYLFWDDIYAGDGSGTGAGNV